MITLIAAAALAAQPAPAANPHSQHGSMRMTAGQHEQHDGMKKDCCKDCCKDMAAKHEGHGAEHTGHSVD
jgi:hypothetical protein